MRQRSIPVDSRQKTSYFSIDDTGLMGRIRDSRVVIFKAICDGRWANTRVAILENTKEASRCRLGITEVEIAMTLPEFYQDVRPGRNIVFYDEEDGIGPGADVVFRSSSDPVIHDSTKAVFRVDVIACNDGFREKNPLSDGPARDME